MFEGDSEVSNKEGTSMRNEAGYYKTKNISVGESN